MEIYKSSEITVHKLNELRDQDKKISNFLSTQLNTQASMLQLTDQLNKEGLIDSQTKKYFENIDKGIQQLLSKSDSK